jgi:two-component system, OmpR family, sensor kinase
MGRLFWKFFLVFWLAQVVTSFGVGISIWALRAEEQHKFRPVGNGEQPLGQPPFFSPDGGKDMPFPPAPPDLSPGHIFPPLMPIVAGSMVSLIFAAWLAWYFSRPIRNLRTAFDAVANGKLDTRIGSSMGGRHDELSDLGQDFDRMASRLQGLMDAQRRLLHDVSHELRSPLARLQVASDLIQQQPERAAEFISRLESDTGRIDALVGELLMLARLDSGMTGRMDQLVALHEMLDHIASDASFEAASRQCTVLADVPENIQIKGNQELLFRAFENVVRNAVQYSPAGKRVDVSARQNASGEWVITVTDEGSGVPPSELEAIFEPFFRGRTEGDNSGYGLGLAIAQRVVQAHGGTVKATNREEGGLAVTITLQAV